MAIADTDPRKGDADETSTGSSKNILENEAKKMVSDAGTSHLSTLDHRFYFNIKDFAFSMPGGWDDVTIRIFIDCFKKFQDDFRLPAKNSEDELKRWQKIVKKCIEQSNFLSNFHSKNELDSFHSTFTVNTVLELAKTLKSYVLTNENKRDDENFKMLYNDVVDILQYLPSDNSVSQNLHRSQSKSEVKVNSNFSPTKVVQKRINSVNDTYIINCCIENPHLIENSGKYSSKHFWGQIADKIFETQGIKFDVKKHLADFKKRVLKEIKTESEPKKKQTLLLDLVGDFKLIFNLINPRTVKLEDYMVVEDEMQLINENITGARSLRTSPRLSTSHKEARTRQYEKSRSDKTIFDRYLSSSSQSESDTPPSPPSMRKRKGRAKKVSPKNELLKSDKCTYEPYSSDDDSILIAQSRRAIKHHLKRGSSSKCANSPPKKVVINSFNESSLNQNIDNLSTSEVATLSSDGRVFPVRTLNSKRPSKQFMSQGISVSVGPNGSYDKEEDSMHANMFSQSVRDPSFDVHCDQPAAPKSTEPKLCPSKPIQPSSSSEPYLQMNACQPAAVPLTHLATQPSGLLRGSQIDSARTDSPSAIHPNAQFLLQGSNPLSSSSVAGIKLIVDHLQKLDEKSLKILEGYKENVMESTPTSESIGQLIPRSLASGSMNQEGALTPLLTSSKPPGWFDKYVCDYKKLEMWKMRQLMKMQEELVDTERKKMSVLEMILKTLSDK